MINASVATRYGQAAERHAGPSFGYGFFTGCLGDFGQYDQAQAQAMARAEKHRAESAAETAKLFGPRGPAPATMLSRSARRQIITVRLIESVLDALDKSPGLDPNVRAASKRLRGYARKILEALGAWPQVQGNHGRQVVAFQRQVRAVQTVVSNWPAPSGCLDTVVYLSAVLVMAEDQRAEAVSTAALWAKACRTLGTLCGHADPDLDDDRQNDGLAMAESMRLALEES